MSCLNCVELNNQYWRSINNQQCGCNVHLFLVTSYWCVKTTLFSLISFIIFSIIDIAVFDFKFWRILVLALCWRWLQSRAQVILFRTWCSLIGLAKAPGCIIILKSIHFESLFFHCWNKGFGLFMQNMLLFFFVAFAFIC